jgi:hypothetical protein
MNIKRISGFLLAMLAGTATVQAGPGGSVEDEVWDAVVKYARTWAEEADADALRDVFHESMVMITPSDRDPIWGREANVEAYAKFLAATRVSGWQFTDQRIQLYAGERAAIVTFAYSVSMLIDGQAVTGAGRDLLALVKERNQWWVVADHFSPFPSQ